MLRLNVQKIEQSCLFNLLWGEGQQLAVPVPFPKELTSLYQKWRKTYLDFYRHQSFDTPNHDWRGRPIGGGTIESTNTDWRGRLTTAEGRLTLAFQEWLQSGQLYKIRATVSQVCQERPESESTNLLIACGSAELTRLPWEVWEIGSEFGISGRVQIARMSPNIQTKAAPVSLRRSRARILAIIGQDNNLNFQKDLEALQAKLKSLVTIETVGWQPGQAISQLEKEIKKAITDEQGWDILFFAGHSNETAMTGGELGIAPGQNLQIQDITEQLKIAKSQGLQFAFFNSCSGLNIAETLIDLGLNQVAVMREPVHNQVAQEFLLQFLQNLAEYKDVRESLVITCKFFKTEKSFTYPSAYLIPSLFHYPNTEWFRLKPSGWEDFFKQLVQPKWYEVTALVALSVLSLLPPVQYQLLEQRVKVQAIYRDKTGQIPNRPAEINLVKIDDASLVEAEIDRYYLARLISHSANLNLNVVGIDYVLKAVKQPEEDQTLKMALKLARETSETSYIFATGRNLLGQRLWTLTQFAAKEWQGDIRVWDQGRYMTLLPLEGEQRPFPLAYIIALKHVARESGINAFRQLDPVHLREKLFFNWMNPSSLTLFSYKFIPGLYQYWFHPIVDFSIPPEKIYNSISAKEFLTTDPDEFKEKYSESVIFIIPGGYADAGINRPGGDIFPPPPAFCYWKRHPCRAILGGEIHAYLFHHFLANRAIMPVPDLWMLWIFALIGKSLSIFIWQYQLNFRKISIPLTISLVVYGIVCLQLYISSSILLPILIPVFILLIYLSFSLNNRTL